MSRSFPLLQAVLEGFVDGVLIFSEHGKLLHANAQARHFCCQLQSLSGQPHHEGQAWKGTEEIPTEIRQVCESLLDSSEMFPDYAVIPEAEVTLADSVRLRVRAQRLNLEGAYPSCLVVTLEDRDQSTQNLAISDVKKYGLTNREAEVWQLRRANCSYKEIASQLHITLNTVKKHMENILAKRKAAAWAEEI